MTTSGKGAPGDDQGDLRRQNPGWLLLRISQDFFSKVVEEFRDRGYLGLQNCHANVLAHLPFEGARITELATSIGVTKQAIGLAVDELARLGYVERAADPEDGRAEVVCFTERGLEFQRDSREIVDAVWDAYADKIGRRQLEGLRVDLERLLLGIEKGVPQRGDE